MTNAGISRRQMMKSLGAVGVAATLGLAVIPGRASASGYHQYTGQGVFTDALAFFIAPLTFDTEPALNSTGTIGWRTSPTAACEGVLSHQFADGQGVLYTVYYDASQVPSFNGGSFTLSSIMSIQSVGAVDAPCTTSEPENPFPEPLFVRKWSISPRDLDGDGRYEDVNGDGVFNALDQSTLIHVLREVVKGNLALTDSQVVAFDFNGDERFDWEDVWRLNELRRTAR